MNIYICPMCKQENGEHQKYCLNCGTWLVDAKKKEALKKSAGSRLGIAIAILAIVGAVWVFTNHGTTSQFANKITFEKIDVGQYTFSQLEITKEIKSSVLIDLTVNEKSTNPIEIAAVFYTEDGTRIGRASTIITNALDAGYKTTLNLKLDEPVSLMATRSVRIEVKPLAPFELLEKAVDVLRSQ